MLKNSNYQRQTKIPLTWCPGCGNYGIFSSLKQALDQLKIEPHQLAVTYDVGCSSNMADFLYAYGFHGLHGRALPLAAGIKLANHRLKVIAVIGDGGCFGEGLNHFVSMARGNHEIVVISHDNFLYSLTTGQKSPTTAKKTITPSTPQGVYEEPLNPLALALISQASFVSRGYAADVPHLSKLIVAALQHPGFSFIDVLQPCVTYNRIQTHRWYQQRLAYLDKTEHDPADFDQALKKSLETKKLSVGLFYQAVRPAFQQNFPLLQKRCLKDLEIDRVAL